MKLFYKTIGWIFIRPVRWFFRNMATACYPRWLPRKNSMYPYYGLKYSMPNIHWYVLYKTVFKFFSWLNWDAWRVFCNWEGGWRRTYPLPARIVHWIGQSTAGYAANGGRCYHCNSEDGNPGDLVEDEKYFTVTDSGSNATMDGTDHWFKGIATCPKCGHKSEYGDSSL